MPTQLASDVALNKHLQDLWSAAIGHKTRTTYTTGFQTYVGFLLKFILFTGPANDPKTLPMVNETLLEYFIAHCFGTLKLAHSTIKNYLAGIRFTYLQAGIHTVFDHINLGSLNRLQTLLRGYKRLQAPTKRNRLPITYNILCIIVQCLRSGILGPFNDMVMETMCVVAFFGFLRCGEFTCTGIFDPSINLCMSDIVFDEFRQRCCLTLKTSKTDPFRQGVTIPLFVTSKQVCPVSCLKRYIHVRQQCGAVANDPLFVNCAYSPIKRGVFLSWLNTILRRSGLQPDHFSGHSFRIGAATSAAHARLEDHLIKTLGRWQSDCFTRYIHTPELVIRQAQLALCTT